MVLGEVWVTGARASQELKGKVGRVRVNLDHEQSTWRWKALSVEQLSDFMCK